MKKVIAVSLILATSACANLQDGVDSVSNMSTGQLVGIVAGAYVGGSLGAEVGGGLGQLISTSIGVVVGAGGGYTIGSILDPTDYALFNDNAQKTLSAENDGVITNWSNPKTGTSGIFRATRSYTTGDGRYCRDYRTAVAIAGGVVENREGFACQQADGLWRSSEDELG